MLFPLSKSFSSSGLFNRGGEHTGPLAHRVWNVDYSGSEERTVDLHKVLCQKKPYSEQLRMIKLRSDELGRKDAEFRRAHSEVLRSTERRLDEECKEHQGEWRKGLAAARRRRLQGELSMTQHLKDQSLAFTASRLEMTGRVNSMPTLCGPPPAREDAERTRLREYGPSRLEEQTRHYFQDTRRLKEKIDSRPMTMTKGPRCRPVDVVVEERKALGLASLYKAQRSYKSQLESVGDELNERMWSTRQATREDYQGHLDFLRTARDEAEKQKDAFKEMVQEELEAREERLRSRPKTFAGYTPKLKSDRRLRWEAAMAEIHA